MINWILRRYPAVRRFVIQRFTPGEYLGLHLTVGFLVAAAGLALFTEIAEDLQEMDGVVAVDQWVADAVYALTTPGGVDALVIITWFGSTAFISLMTAVAALILLVRGSRQLAAAWVATVAGGGAIVVLLKGIFRRERPSWDVPFVVEHSWSFPSGHTTGALVAYGMLAYVLMLGCRRHRDRVVGVSACVVMVLLIGFSRIYLGAHFLSDVLAGYAIGSAWLGICISAVEVLRRRGARMEAADDTAPPAPRPEGAARG